MSVFKENDIRGLFPEEWNIRTVSKIAAVFPRLFEGKRIALARDGRLSSTQIRDALMKDMVALGFKVLDIGVADTPAVYFAVGRYGLDGGVMITASHNPPGYNGLKLTGKGCVPINSGNGLEIIRDHVEGNAEPAAPPETPGTGSWKPWDIAGEYSDFLAGFAAGELELPVQFDFSSGSASRFGEALAKRLMPRAECWNTEVDGNFPVHGPNPAQPENLRFLQEKLCPGQTGFCFDGDGDRVVMVDSKGGAVSPDFINVLIGLYYFKWHPEKRRGNDRVLVDIRSSRRVKEFLESLGARVDYCPVGHAKIKKMLRDKKALFAGELTGHYYFEEYFYSDSPWPAILMVLDVLHLEKTGVAELQEKILTSAFSGELNFSLMEGADTVLSKITKTYEDADLSTMDGFRFDYPDWWFIVRKSGTEPLMRLVVEAETDSLLEEKVGELTRILQA